MLGSSTLKSSKLLERWPSPSCARARRQPRAARHLALGDDGALRAPRGTSPRAAPADARRAVRAGAAAALGVRARPRTCRRSRPTGRPGVRAAGAEPRGRRRSCVRRWKPALALETSASSPGLGRRRRRPQFLKRRVRRRVLQRWSNFCGFGSGELRRWSNDAGWRRLRGSSAAAAGAHAAGATRFDAAAGPRCAHLLLPAGGSTVNRPPSARSRGDRRSPMRRSMDSAAGRG